MPMPVPMPVPTICRRTDLLSKVHRPAARYSRIDGNFFNPAMDMYRYMLLLLSLQCFLQKGLFRFKYNHMNQKVLFIAASDDPDWLKANLRGVDNDLYFSVDLFGSYNRFLQI